MAKLHSTPSNQRFTWLKAPAMSAAVNGPWILSEHKNVHSESLDKQQISISADNLLNLMASCMVATQSQSATMSATTLAGKHDHAHSECGKFEIRRLKMAGDAARLFVQKRDDYFQRLELYVNNELIAAYNEPVWPHLQYSTAGSRLTLPLACIEFLESIASHHPDTNTPCESANQADINDPGNATATAA